MSDEDSPELRPDISQNYALKSAIEGLLGNRAWLDLKETTSLATWRRYVVKLLSAIELSIDTTVLIRDEDWAAKVRDNLNYGRKLVRGAKTIEDLLSALSATLLRQVFLQIGLLPSRRTAQRPVALTKENWRLDVVRSVQYVQSPAQVEAAFWARQQREIGFEKQMELNREHRASRTKMPYSASFRSKKASSDAN